MEMMVEVQGGMRRGPAERGQTAQAPSHAAMENDPFNALSLLAEVETALIGALDLVPMPVWITDSRGRLCWSNRAAVTEFGTDDGIHFSRFVSAERVNEARELFARKITGAVDSNVQTTVLIGRDGPVDAEMVSVPLSRDNAIAAVLFMARIVPTREVERTAIPRPRLTPRQHDVLKLLTDGLTTDQIAERLSIAPDTARNHIRMLLTELGVHSRLSAVVTAFRNGWL
jgi:DNA-binding CsgD family transcriptional regulator